MDFKQYNPETAEVILKKLYDKNWNVYPMNEVRQNLITGDDNIRKGPANFLEFGRPYVLLPLVENPQDPEQVMGAFERLGQKLERKIPVISFDSKRYEFTGLTLRSYNVKVHGPEGIFAFYKDFIQALDNIVDTKDPGKYLAGLAAA